MAILAYQTFTHTTKLRLAVGALCWDYWDYFLSEKVSGTKHSKKKVKKVQQTSMKLFPKKWKLQIKQSGLRIEGQGLRAEEKKTVQG